MSEHCPRPCLFCNRRVKFGDDVMVYSVTVGRMYFHLKCARLLGNRLLYEVGKPKQCANKPTTQEGNGE